MRYFMNSCMTTVSLLAILGLTACSQPAQPENKVEAKPASSAEATMPAPATAGQKIRIATEGAYRPFNFKNADGSLSGYDVDVAKAVCAELKADCEIVAQDWEGILPGLLAKKYDVVASGMSISPERSAQVDFSTPYFKNTMVWLSTTDGKFSPQAVKGYHLGGQRSTTLAQYLQDTYGKDNEVKLYDTYDNAYMEVKSGRVQAVLSEKVTATEWLKQNADGKFGIIGDEMDNNDNIAMAVRKDDPLKAQIDTALATLQQNGTLANLQKQHFGQ